MVREAVLKSKDPRKILEEIEKIENMGKQVILCSFNDYIWLRTSGSLHV